VQVHFQTAAAIAHADYHHSRKGRKNLLSQEQMLRSHEFKNEIDGFDVDDVVQDDGFVGAELAKDVVVFLRAGDRRDVRPKRCAI